MSSSVLHLSLFLDACLSGILTFNNYSEEGKHTMRKQIYGAVAILMTIAFIVPMFAVNQVQAQSWEPRDLTATLEGSGASFPNPLYQRYIRDYRRVVPSVRISYESVGSGQGIRDFLGGVTDFGGTDAVISDDDFDSSDLHVPMVMGAVVATYNLPGRAFRRLRFSPDTLANIFLGNITQWNDEAIQADNPRVRNLPDTPITVIHRSDSSGTTSIFTSYLSDVSSDWANGPGAGTTVDWPTGQGEPRNDGVADGVRNTEGAIGYVEFIFARSNRLPTPSIQNSSERWIRPSIRSVTAAASGVDYDDPDNEDLRIAIVNESDRNAYPIAGFTWLLVRENGPEGLTAENEAEELTKAQALTDYIYWTLTTRRGVRTAARLGYAPLPREARERAIEQLEKVNINDEFAFVEP